MAAGYESTVHLEAEQAGLADVPLASLSAAPDPYRDRDRGANAQIMKAAVELFAEHGYDGVSMRELAARAGCSPANVYHHHRSKYDLFVTIVEASMMLHLAGLRAALAAHDDPVEQLRSVLDHHLRLHMEHPEFRLLKSDFHPLRGEERRRFIEERDEYEHGVRAIVARGKELGLLEVEDTKLAVMVTLVGCTYIHSWYRSDGPLSSAEIARRITGFFLAGFGVRAAG
jgi:AcrR family transcriptional regulator